MSISFVQGTSGTGNGNGAATTTNFGSSTTAGNAIIVAAYTGTSTVGEISGVTDNKSNTYTKITSNLPKAYNFIEVELWYCLNITGGANHNVKATSSSAGDSVLCIAQEFSGLATSGAFDVAHSNNGDSNSLDSGNSATTAIANELIIGAGGTNSGNAVTVGTNFSNLTTARINLQLAGGLESRIVSSAAAYNATFGTANTPSWVAAVATFEAPSTSSLTVSVSDSVTTSETISATLVDNVLVSDSSTTSETITLLVISLVSVSDTSSTTEAISVLEPALNTNYINTSEAVTTAETPAVNELVKIAVSDSTATTETIVLNNLQINTSDATVITETVTSRISLSDNFNESPATIDANRWQNVANNSLANNQLVQALPASNTTYANLNSQATYNATSTSNFVELVSVGDQTIASKEVYFEVIQDTNNIVFFYVQSTANGSSLVAYKKVAGSTTFLASIAYNATTMRWLQIAESSGTTYWQYAQSGSGLWTTLYSVANPITMTSVQVELLSGTYALETSATSVIWDNFNLTTLTPSISDAATTTEALTVSIVDFVNVTDSSTTSESVNTGTFLALGTAVSDTTTASESINVAVAFTISVMPTNLAYLVNGVKVV